MNHTYLAFDFGLKRIGVAVGQNLTKSANPLPHLVSQKGFPPWDQIRQLINSWKPKAIIVGIPLQLDDTEQKLTFLARAFAKELQERFHIEVHEVDERLSTKEARSRMFESGGFKALKKGLIDSVAAKIILEAWLLTSS